VGADGIHHPHLTLGSHKSYPVTIHNYRKTVKMKDRETGETVLKTFTINKWKTVTYEEFNNGLRPEPILEGLPEGVPEGLLEHCLKVYWKGYRKVYRELA